MKKLFFLLFLLFPFLLFAQPIPNGPSGVPLSSGGSSSGGAGSFNTITTSTNGSNLAPNVGIGSANPGQALDVQGTVRAFSFITSGIGDGYLQLNANAADTSTPAAGTSTLYEKSDKSLYFQDSDGLITNLLNSGSAGGWSYTSPLIKLATVTDNVGIGTVSALTKLAVGGNAAIGSTYAGINTAPSNSLIVSGNLGIGTFNPNQSLMVYGGNVAIQGSVNSFGTSGRSILQSNNSNTQYIDVRSYGTAYNSDTFLGNNLQGGTAILGNPATSGIMAIGTNSNAPIVFGSNNLERFRLTAAGNVGFGTTTPKAGFSMVGNFGIGSTPSSTFITTNAPVAGIIVEGNVGIGSAAPGQKLDIQGTVRIAGSGHLISTGTAPTVANNDCGSTSQGAIVANSTDISGAITVGTLTVTSCAVTFASAYVNAPNCVAMDDSNILAIKASATTTKLTLTSTTSSSGDIISWICIGN